MSSAEYPRFSVDFENRVVIVTGAASGIGAEVARSLVASGARVLATDRSPVGLASLVEAASDLPGSVATFEADLLDPAAPAAIVAAALAEFGAIDGLVSCAGVFETAAIEDVTPESFDRVIGINLKAPIFLVGAARPHLGRGSAIVLIASGTSIGPTGYQGVYAASKAGIAKLAASLAAEVGEAGIRVNAVSPGFTDTPMIASSLEDTVLTDLLIQSIPDRSIGTPKDVADAVMFLLSDGARHIHGINLPLDGGFSQVAVTPALRAAE